MSHFTKSLCVFAGDTVRRCDGMLIVMTILLEFDDCLVHMQEIDTLFKIFRFLGTPNSTIFPNIEEYRYYQVSLAVPDSVAVHCRVPILFRVYGLRGGAVKIDTIGCERMKTLAQNVNT